MLKNKIEILLGLGLGLGHLTSLRFIKYVGISEILILFAIIILLSKRSFSFKFNTNYSTAIIVYFLFVFFIQLPIVTGVVSYNTELISAPPYILSFGMGVFLFILLVQSFKENKINMPIVINLFFYGFVLSNMLFYIFFPEYSAPFRFKGEANNPNQLMFYASSLSLLLILYKTNFRWLKLSLVVFIGLQSKSDAYDLVLFLSLFLLLYYNLFFNNKLEFNLKLTLFSLVSVVLIFSLGFFFTKNISDLWYQGDEGGGRIELILNGLKAAFKSPLVGWGAGSFSGVERDFMGSEAHSSFIDLATQVGFIIPIIIYIISLKFIILKLKEGQFLAAAFVSAYLSSGFFHYNARHFFYWVEFSIFYYYVMERISQKKIFRSRDLNQLPLK